MSDMIEVKTADLTGPALDWAVAHATKAWEWAHEWFPTMTLDPTFLRASNHLSYGKVVLIPNNPMRQDAEFFQPSTDWAQGGRLIQKHLICLTWFSRDSWRANVSVLNGPTTYVLGPQPLIAACRALALHELGDVINVPAEMLT